MRINSLTSVGVIAMFLSVSAYGTDEIKLERAGFCIEADARVAKDVYPLPDPDGVGAVLIEGDDITVDFNGATLIGFTRRATPDTYTGRGVVVRGRNVTIKNLKTHGYKVGLYAEDSPGIRVTNSDVSRNYRQRLRSTIEREDLADWLYGHENDDNEWLRYGAGIYLLRCPRATVSTCRARNGQNGLCLVRCDEARVVDCDFSFLSGWGLAMWRSSRCEVFNNKFDWCVRGYSHGVYARGQDSAGILVYEQCNDNLFAYNSATHGGDGFFLYAGNETVQRTGKGGCQRNILYRNDFSHAVANGIEATFSEGNVFVENVLLECTHGVWAGYSSDTIIERNDLAKCTNGISIEHGQRNRIAGNTFRDMATGVHLWWDEDEALLASAFGKAHDRCPSQGNRITDNRFLRVETAIHLAEDAGGEVARNTFQDASVPLQVSGRAPGLKAVLEPAERSRVRLGTKSELAFARADAVEAWAPLDVVALKPRLTSRAGKQEALLPVGARRGREYIFIDEWGPYDFTDYRLFPERVTGGREASFYVLAPGAPFQMITTEGEIEVNPKSGLSPAKITVQATETGVRPFAVDIEVGEQERRVSGVLMSSEWRVRFYKWTESLDPRESPENWAAIVRQEPLEMLTRSSIDFAWGGRAPSAKVPPDHFATVATTKLALPAGRWRVRTVSDDGVRVFVDGREVLRNWTWHAPTTDETEVDLEAGEHDIRIEHFEIDGFAWLAFVIEPAVP